MTYFQAIILGLVQGFTEFIPVSSSGHLALIQSVFSLQNPLAYAIILHFGTFFSVLYFFRAKFIDLVRQIYIDFKNRKLNHTLILVIIATLPIVLVGLFIKDIVASFYQNHLVIAISFFLTSILLFLAASQKQFMKKLAQIKPIDALVIGIFQLLAVLPGVSRSGATVSASFLRQVNKKTAFYFSFLISLPATFGALVIESHDLAGVTQLSLPIILVGIITSFISGLLALKLFKNFIIKDKLVYFAIYTFIVGVITLMLS